MEELIERFVSIPRVEELLSTVDIDEEAEALLIRQRKAVNSVLRSYSCYIKSKNDEKKAQWYDKLLRNLVTFRQRELDILKQDPVYFALVFMAAQSRNAPYLVKFETLKRVQNMRYEFANDVMEKEDELIRENFIQRIANNPILPKDLRQDLKTNLGEMDDFDSAVQELSESVEEAEILLTEKNDD